MVIGRSNSWWKICLIIMVSFVSMVSLSNQSDTILPSQSIPSQKGIYPNGQTITSRGGIFELGFFSYGITTNIYVGIWYKNIPNFTVVWTANRDAPILSSNKDDANLIFTREGDLQLQVNGQMIWNTNTTITDLNTAKAVLLDSGNLIVGSDSSPNMWESFNHPSSTWLPGAKIGFDVATGKTDPIILIAWNGKGDPSSGVYSFGIDQNGSSELIIWNKTDTVWRIGALDFSEMNLEFKLNITFNIRRKNGVNYVTYHTLDNSTLIRMVLHADGQLRQYIYKEKSARFVTVWTRPNVCDNGATCKSNGVCSKNQSPLCSCPKGFEPTYTSTELHDYFEGCARLNRSQCFKDKDEFIALHKIKTPQNHQSLSLGSAEDCRSSCAHNCGCSAYSNTIGC